MGFVHAWLLGIISLLRFAMPIIIMMTCFSIDLPKYTSSKAQDCTRNLTSYLTT